MDTSKHFFQLHGVNAAEKVVLRKKLRRKERVVFFEALAPTVIGIEACGASHHWRGRPDHRPLRRDATLLFFQECGVDRCLKGTKDVAD
jgi:hypothetical protein